MSSTNLLEGDTIKLKCSVKLKSSNQLHLFAKNRGPLSDRVRLQFETINSLNNFLTSPKRLNFEILFSIDFTSLVMKQKTLVSHNGERQRGDQNLFSRSSYHSPFYRHRSRALVKR